MLRYLARRLVWGVFTMWAVSVLSFIVIQLPPGDYATSYVAHAADQSGTTNVDIDVLRHQLGLDKPYYVQYLDWIKGILHGDFGLSLTMHRPVADIISGSIGYTSLIAVMAIVFTWFVALPLGVYAAVNRNSIGDFVTAFLGFFFLALPAFLLALVMLYFVFEWFGVSVSGLFSPQYETAPWSGAKLVNMLEHLIIPAIVLSTGGMAYLQRIMRANLLDELGKNYVVTAQAKGMRRWRLILKYPTRVALNPFASTIGLQFRSVFSDTIIVSVVLSLPTLGPILLAALRAQDMTLAGAIILLLGVLTIVGTLISDLILVALDPRIRHAG
jgi:peptide/nickel transport system permease protein